MTLTPVKITIVVDNHAGEGLITEHGLSLWIETDGKHILFDTGQGKALEFNAQALDVDLSQTDILILSHGHYDHTGGIPHVLKKVQNLDVYCHPDVFQSRYSIREGTAKPIQMPSESKNALDMLPMQKIHRVSQALGITVEIGITGPIPRETGFEDTGGPFYLDPEGRSADRIDDDLALWIQTVQGWVVCVGCCHAGLVNTLNQVKRLTKQDRICAIIGGFHLLNADYQRLKLTVTALQSFSPNGIYPCHCTGKEAIKALQTAFGEKVVPAYAGAKYEF